MKGGDISEDACVFDANGFAWLGLWMSISMLFDRYAMIKPVGPVLSINALIAAVCMVALAYMAD